MEDSNSNCALDMTSKTMNAEKNKAKRLKRLEEGDCILKSDKELSKNILSLNCFKFKRVLNEDVSSKTIFLEADHEESNEKAVLILEKQPFIKDSIEKILTAETSLTEDFNNDIYKRYQAFPKAELNGVQTTIIYPATEKHVVKYLYQPLYVVEETSEIYQKVVLPHIESYQFSLQWVQNILDGKKEVERTIFQDPDPETGFVLVPDTKWNEKDVSSLYILAIARKNLKSLRDLDASHLPLLRNIYEKSLDAIEMKYSLSRHKIRMYIHYQPSYYHFHVHFTNVEYLAPGITVDRAHLLKNVIDNLVQSSDYYKKTLLIYTVKESDPLYKKLKDANVFS